MTLFLFCPHLLAAALMLIGVQISLVCLVNTNKTSLALGHFVQLPGRDEFASNHMRVATGCHSMAFKYQGNELVINGLIKYLANQLAESHLPIIN